MAIPISIDPRDLFQAGWGVIFATDTPPGVREALEPLLQLRQEQSGAGVRTFEYIPGETQTQFLARHGARPGLVDPGSVPYYLLIAADPESVPFGFQARLGVQYAVGRLWFDTEDGFNQYAENTVAVESGLLSRWLPAAVFFGPQHAGDPYSLLLAETLVRPLAEWLTAETRSAAPDWRIWVHSRGEASKQRLARLLDSSTPPALLFTGGHGLGFAPAHELQRADQGALLCQDWPGPQNWSGPIPPEHYYSGQDVPQGADLMGMIGIHYSSYSAGTPQEDQFIQAVLDSPSEIAPQAFVARLPQQLLARGAGAVVGLTDRAWGYSFPAGEQAGDLALFQSSLRRLLGGDPVGYAFQFFKERYAELATAVTSELEDISFGREPDVPGLASRSTAMNDALRLTILGDPAVRLPAPPPLSSASASASSY